MRFRFGLKIESDTNFVIRVIKMKRSSMHLTSTIERVDWVTFKNWFEEVVFSAGILRVTRLS